MIIVAIVTRIEIPGIVTAAMRMEGCRPSAGVVWGGVVTGSTVEDGTVVGGDVWSLPAVTKKQKW